VRAQEQLDPETVALRREWSEWMGEIDPERFIFLDESNAKTTMTRRYGRAPRGERVVDHVPAGEYHATTILGALRYDGTVAAMVYEGGTDVAVMQAFAAGELQTILRPRDIVVMDNLSAHKDAGAIAAIEAAGAIACFLPPYSPDLNPIELAFARLKRLLRSDGHRTVPTLVTFLESVGRAFRPAECAAYIRHCGYEQPPATNSPNQR
jgi:transposase